jgi:hypothetical protein
LECIPVDKGGHCGWRTSAILNVSGPKNPRTMGRRKRSPGCCLKTSWKSQQSSQQCADCKLSAGRSSWSPLSEMPENSPDCPQGSAGWKNTEKNDFQTSGEGTTHYNKPSSSYPSPVCHLFPAGILTNTVKPGGDATTRQSP